MRFCTYTIILSVVLFTAFPLQAQTPLPPEPYQSAKPEKPHNGTKFFGVGGTVPVIDYEAIAKAISTYKKLKEQYAKVKAKYDLAMKMSRYISNMPQRYKMMLHDFHNINNPDDVFNGIDRIARAYNGDIYDLNTINTQSDQLFQKTSVSLNKSILPAIPDDKPEQKQQQQSLKSNLALQRDAWKRGFAALGDAAKTQKENKTKITNLDADSLSGSESLNSEVAVLNKINAVLMAQIKLQQTNQKLLLALVAQQNAALKPQHDQLADYENIMNEAKAALTEANKPVDTGWDNWTSLYSKIRIQ